ncbi:hypothetical protein DFH06DRAFT_1485133 [Mycena polygramma]|nr:hypothetical protein DFH06DRAFT_1485133 [Mycena polygramma]
MQSLFSRARTASTPSKSKHKPPSGTAPPLPTLSTNLSSASARVSTPIDEFGGYAQAGGGGGLGRSRSASASASMPPAGPGDAGYGAVGFLPTTLPADPAVPWAASPHSLSLSASTSSKDKDKDKDGIVGRDVAVFSRTLMALAAVASVFVDE